MDWGHQAYAIEMSRGPTDTRNPSKPKLLRGSGSGGPRDRTCSAAPNWLAQCPPTFRMGSRPSRGLKSAIYGCGYNSNTADRRFFKGPIREGGGKRSRTYGFRSTVGPLLHRCSSRGPAGVRAWRWLQFPSRISVVSGPAIKVPGRISDGLVTSMAPNPMNS
jgi:hypothetical protein